MTQPLVDNPQAQEMAKLRKEVDETFNKLLPYIQNLDANLKTIGHDKDKNAKDISALNDSIDDKKLMTQEIVAELEKKFGTLRKEFARASSPGMGKPTFRVDFKSLGQHLIQGEETRAKEQHNVLKSMINEGIYHSRKIKVSKADVSNWGGRYSAVERLMNKANELTSTELGALIQEFRWQTIVQQPLRPTLLEDLIPAVTVNSDTVEYPEEDVTHELVAFISSGGAASGQKVIPLKDTAEGFIPGSVVVVDPGGGGEESGVVDTVDYDALTITLVDNLGNTHAEDIKVTAENFAYTPEAKIKPMSRIEFVLRVVSLKELATIMPFAKRLLEDFPALQRIIDTRMQQFKNLSKERQILYGNDTIREIQGILTHPDINTILQGGGDTKLDTIRKALTFVFLAFFPGDAVVLHPNDMQDIELLKGTDDHYVFSQIQTSAGVPIVWRAQIVETPVIDALTGLTGSFQMGAVLWDRGDLEISVSDQNRDWWEKNIIGIRVEERSAQSIIRPKSFTEITFI